MIKTRKTIIDLQCFGLVIIKFSMFFIFENDQCFVVVEKLYQVRWTGKTVDYKIAHKNAWQREVSFEILIAEVMLLPFVKIC